MAGQAAGQLMAKCAGQGGCRPALWHKMRGMAGAGQYIAKRAGCAGRAAGRVRAKQSSLHSFFQNLDISCAC